MLIEDSGRLSPRDGKRRRRLHQLITAGCNSRDIAKALECTPQYIRRLVEANGFRAIWEEAKAARKKKRPVYQRIARMRWRITQPVLEAFRARGFEVTKGRIADECLIEGMQIAVFAPRIPFQIKNAQYGTRYFAIHSKYLQRFLIILLPNGKKLFYFPRKPGQRYLSIPEWQLDTPEVWPLRADFRKWKSLQHTERKLARQKEKSEKNTGINPDDLLYWLGVETAPIEAGEPLSR